MEKLRSEFVQNISQKIGVQCNPCSKDLMHGVDLDSLPWANPLAMRPDDLWLHRFDAIYTIMTKGVEIEIFLLYTANWFLLFMQ